MTDKEKRELKNGVTSIFKRFNILDHTATIGGLKNDILTFINSLQEEPCNSCQGFNDKDKCDELVFTHNCPIVKNPVSIWHDASEKSNEPEEVVIIKPSDNTGDVLTRCTGVYQGRIWAYTSDLLKFDNSCKIGKNLQEEPKIPQVFDEGYWERLGEEPVSKEIGDYDHKAVMESLHPKLKEEPVSEELEAEIERINKNSHFDFSDWKAIARHFANWQKEQDKETIELAEDHAMLAGMVKGKEDIVGKVRSILNKVAYKNNGLDVNGDYCEQPYVELDNEFRKLLKEEGV